MKVQEQHWKDFDRYLLINDHVDASVRVSIRRSEPNLAIIDSLWVAEKDRGNGDGGFLLETAEMLAKSKGCEYVALSYDETFSPTWVLDWYKRIGYKPYKVNSVGWILLKKEIQNGSK